MTRFDVASPGGCLVSARSHRLWERYPPLRGNGRVPKARAHIKLGPTSSVSVSCCRASNSEGASKKGCLKTSLRAKERISPAPRTQRAVVDVCSPQRAWGCSTR